jgi:hypothetical protein
VSTFTSRPAIARISLVVTIGLVLGFIAVGCLSGGPQRSTRTHALTAVRPIDDLGVRLYLGRFQGGLYPNGANTIPADHLAAGLERARSIRPRDAKGNLSPAGKYILLSVGMSNATQEFCCPGGNSPTPWSFMGRAAADASVNYRSLVIINGAKATKTAEEWTSPTSPEYGRVAAELRSVGLSEAQVAVVWVKQVNPFPTTSLPNADADAYTLEQDLGDIVRALQVRYPNVQLVFFSSRAYGGYATTDQTPEPYAYETGFSVKWLIEAQIRQMQDDGRIGDSRAGDLNYDTVAPWIGWGPYLWANGLKPRSDGLIWDRRDFGPDGSHPSPIGERKVATLLLTFFKTSALTKEWFQRVAPGQ